MKGNENLPKGAKKFEWTTNAIFSLVLPITSFKSNIFLFRIRATRDCLWRVYPLLFKPEMMLDLLFLASFL